MPYILSCIRGNFSQLVAAFRRNGAYIREQSGIFGGRSVNYPGSDVSRQDPPPPVGSRQGGNRSPSALLAVAGAGYDKVPVAQVADFGAGYDGAGYGKLPVAKFADLGSRYDKLPVAQVADTAGDYGAARTPARVQNSDGGVRGRFARLVRATQPDPARTTTARPHPVIVQRLLDSVYNSMATELSGHSNWNALSEFHDDRPFKFEWQVIEFIEKYVSEDLDLPWTPIFELRCQGYLNDFLDSEGDFTDRARDVISAVARGVMDSGPQPWVRNPYDRKGVDREEFEFTCRP